MPPGDNAVVRRLYRWIIPDSAFTVDARKVAVDYWEQQFARLGLEVRW